MNHLFIGINNKLNILSLSLIGGVSGRFLGGLVAWNVFNLENNKKYTLKWYFGFTLINLSMIGGLIYLPMKFIKYRQITEN